jgi:hypothetical protein
MTRITFVIGEFEMGTPAQQLLDRFLLGYPRDGEFHLPTERQIAVYLSNTTTSPDLDRRVRDHGLTRSNDLAAALTGASGIVVVPGTVGEAGDQLIRRVLENAPAGAACFVHGVLGRTGAEARRHAELATSKKLKLLAGTSVGVTWRLPEVELTPGAAVSEALIVVQGSSPEAELEGLDGLLPVIAHRRGGEAGVQSVHFVAGDALWRAGHDGAWSWKLLASALSRSDSPQGDSVKDGRTQDLVGLGLVPKLARAPRGWMIEHRDRMRSAVLVLDGVVADYNFAVQLVDGPIVSAQLFRPPKPARHQFSRLAAVMEDFLLGSRVPWPVERSVLEAGLLEALVSSTTRPGVRCETPDL